MDFNTLYEIISPYIGTSGIALVAIGIIWFLLSAKKTLNSLGISFSNTENEVIKAFKKALPKELYVSIEALTKKELGKIIDKIETLVNDKFLNQIRENTEIIKAVALALVSIKSIPDSTKIQIIDLLDSKEKVETTESLKVDLNSIEKEDMTKENVKSEVIYVE